MQSHRIVAAHRALFTQAIEASVQQLEQRLLFSASSSLTPAVALHVPVTAASAHSQAANNQHQKKPKKNSIVMDPAYAADHAFAEEETGPIQIDVQPIPDTPSPSSTIEAANFDNNPTFNGGFAFIPPDNSGTAGPNHVVNVINDLIQWFTKAGTNQMTESLASFFTSLSPLTVPGSGVSALFDPKVVFDTYNNRFIVVTLEHVDTGTAAQNDSRILLAVSQTSDPNGGWFFTAVNSALSISGHSCWLDYPGLAIDSTAIYVTGNMFAFASDSTPGAFEGSRCLIVSKSGFFTGGSPTSAVFYDPSVLAALPGNAFTLQPSIMYGTTPGSTGTFLVNSGWVSGATDFLSVIRVDNPLASPTFTNTFISLGDIHNGTVAFPGPVPQSGTATGVDGGDQRILSAVWRNNTLWAVNDINPTSTYDATNAGQETAHWYKINTTTLSSLTLSDQGDVGGEDVATGAWTFFPSIAVDSTGNIAIDFSVSSSTTFPSAAYTVHTTSDPASSVEASVVFATGVNFYVRTFGGPRNRWGDYSSMVIDPAGTTFWAYNQYAATQAAAGTERGRWGTRYAAFSLTATGSVSGTLFQDNMSDGTLNGSDVGLSGQTVFLDVNNNGLPDDGANFTATTGAGGTFTLPTVPPGTYNMKEVLPSGFVESGPAGNAYSVMVTAGGVLTGFTFPNFPITYPSTAGTDNYTVQLDATGTNFQVLVGASLTYQAPKTLLTSLPSAVTFALGSGDDSLTINGANGGNPVPASPGISFDGGTNTVVGDTLSVIGTSGNDTFTASSTAVTFGGNPINYTNTETVNLDPQAGSDSLTVNSGTVHLPAQTPGGGLLNRHFSTLMVNSTGLVVVNSPGVQTDRTALQIDSLSGSASPQLDITKNEATINLPLATVVPLIGHQIISSAITGSSSPFGIGSNAMNGGTQTRIRLTYLGDTDLDGHVNIQDLSNLAGNFGKTAGATWIQGDFDYNGTVNVADLADLAGNFGLTFTS
jgi:hypothetical protein